MELSIMEALPLTAVRLFKNVKEYILVVCLNIHIVGLPFPEIAIAIEGECDIQREVNISWQVSPMYRGCIVSVHKIYYIPEQPSGTT